MSEDYQRIKVLFAGILGLLLFLGVARFAYTPLLPLMREQAGLGIEAAGWLASANYAGYLLGVLSVGRIGDMPLKDKVYRASMVLAIFSTIMMGLTQNVWLWALSRLIAGLSTSAGMVLGSALIMNWLIRKRHRSELGIHFSGIGLGIVLCSLIVIAIDDVFDWRSQWYLLSLIGALLAIPAWRWLPYPESSQIKSTASHMQDCPPSRAFINLLMLFYICAGAGYVVSATFIVAIVDAFPQTAGKGTWIFLIVGLAAAPSCILWDFIARRLGQVNALILASFMQIIGILLPAFVDGMSGATIGAILFGGTFAGMVSLVMSMAGRYFPSQPAKMMGKMSATYGVAQIVAPAITGLLAQKDGSYVHGLYFAAGLMLIGIAMLGMTKLIERMHMNAPHR